jgi:hypothetical protein
LKKATIKLTEKAAWRRGNVFFFFSGLMEEKDKQKVAKK